MKVAPFTGYCQWSVAELLQRLRKKLSHKESWWDFQREIWSDPRNWASGDLSVNSKRREELMRQIEEGEMEVWSLQKKIKEIEKLVA